MPDTQKSKTILVVDDDPTQVKLLEGILTNNGFTMMTATEAADGLQMAMTQSPDLIILDVMMPIINGYNFCHLLKSQEIQKKIPVILVTSRDEKKDFDIGHEMGADTYLTKPVNTEELLKAINRLLR